MVTVGDLLAVAGLVCVLLFIAGWLVFLAWMADQQKVDQTKGGEE